MYMRKQAPNIATLTIRYFKFIAARVSIRRWRRTLGERSNTTDHGSSVLAASFQVATVSSKCVSAFSNTFFNTQPPPSPSYRTRECETPVASLNTSQTPGIPPPIADANVDVYRANHRCSCEMTSKTSRDRWWRGRNRLYIPLGL